MQVPDLLDRLMNDDVIDSDLDKLNNDIGLLNIPQDSGIYIPSKITDTAITGKKINLTGS